MAAEGVTSYLLLSCIAAAMGGFLFGFDLGIIGGVTSMDSFLKTFFPQIDKRQKDGNVSNYCKFNSLLLTTFTASLYLSGLVASIFASSVTRNLGRKPSMLIAGLFFLAGIIIGISAVNVYMLIIGRLMVGVGLGFSTQSVPIYLSEMAPSNLRGAISNGFQLSVSTGALSANIISYGTEKIKTNWGWRVSLSVAAIPALLLTLGALFLPETPNSLLQRHADPQIVRHLLQKIRGTEDVETELDTLIAANTSPQAKSTSSPLRVILNRRHRPHLVMAFALPFFQQVTGMAVVNYYAPVLFRSIGLGESIALFYAVLTRLTSVLATLISMMLVDKLGRRVLFMSGGVQMLVSQLMIGVIMAEELHDEGVVSKGYAYGVLVLICLFVAGFGWSWGPLGWVVPGEIFPMEVRSVGQSIVVVVNFFSTFLITETFLGLLCSLKAGIFFFFCGWVAVMTLFVYLLLPETKNVPLEQMTVAWQDHWFWKRIVHDTKQQQLN